MPESHRVFRQYSPIIRDPALYFSERSLNRHRQRMIAEASGDLEPLDERGLQWIRESVRVEVKAAERLIRERSHLLARSYYAATKGSSLIEGCTTSPPDVFARNLFHTSEGALLFHGTEDDPTFLYGNAQAIDIFGRGWVELMKTHSKHTALEADREERLKAFDVVERDGILRGYSGRRVTKDSKHLFIDQATLWKVFDKKGVHHGLAAWIRDYHFL